jgi:RNA polymerase sigma-70 factor (ECF subfamily)
MCAMTAELYGPGTAAPPVTMGETPIPPAQPDEMDLLVRSAAAGDRAAIERLLSRLVPRLRNLIRYLLRGDQDVDDVAQEVLTVVYRRIETYRGDGAFLAWIDRVAVRATFAWRRRAAARREVLHAEPEEMPPGDREAPSGPDAFVARRRFVVLLDTIPEEQRDTLVMHHVLGFSVPEIAAELSISAETIRSRLRLGRSRLRAGMGGGEE